MGREIQELGLYHINSHRGWNRVHNPNHENLRPVVIHNENSEGSQKDTQSILEEMLKCEFWNKEIVRRKFIEVSHRNPYPKNYCCELTAYSLGGPLNLQIEEMIWGFLGSNEGHREAMLDEYHEHTHAGVEIAHDKNNSLTVLTVRLSKI